LAGEFSKILRKISAGRTDSSAKMLCFGEPGKALGELSTGLDPRRVLGRIDAREGEIRATYVICVFRAARVFFIKALMEGCRYGKDASRARR